MRRFTKPCAFRLLPQELEELQELADEERRPLANLLALIVRDWLKARRAQQAARRDPRSLRA
jgi:hypothetical protein